MHKWLNSTVESNSKYWVRDFLQSRGNAEHSGHQSFSDLDKILQCLISMFVFPKDKINILSTGYSNTLTTER